VQVGDLVEYSGTLRHGGNGSLDVIDPDKRLPRGIVLEVDVASVANGSLLWVKVHWIVAGLHSADYVQGWHTTRYLTVLSTKAEVN